MTMIIVTFTIITSQITFQLANSCPVFLSRASLKAHLNICRTIHSIKVQNIYILCVPSL